MKKLLLSLVLIFIPSLSYADDIWIFSATWCKPCRELKTFLKTYYRTLKNQGHRITIIDIDENTDLKKEYGITAVPTTIIFDDNNSEKARTSGFNKTIWRDWIQSNTK